MKKISRNYKLYPLKKIKCNTPTGYTYERPSYDDLYTLYITYNLRKSDLVKYFNISKSALETFLKEYKIIKSKDLHLKNIKKSVYEKYGVENIFQYKPIIDKSKEKCLKLYGCTNISQSNTWKNIIHKNCLNISRKRFHTLQKNGTLGKTISNEENKIGEMLKIKFPLVKSQYMCKKYPWKCDFYIPEIDTYIEYQGFWMHGKEPYKGTKEQFEKIKLWESKNTQQYKRAIKTWTEIDVEKRIQAYKSNIKYLEFFNMNDFIKWYNTF